MANLKCRSCPHQAFFDFGKGILLCADCISEALQHCRIDQAGTFNADILDDDNDLAAGLDPGMDLGRKSHKTRGRMS